MSQTGHPSVRVVLTAFMEDRLYFRNDNQKVFIVKAADEDPLNLIDPLGLFTNVKDKGKIPVKQFVKIVWTLSETEMRVSVDGEERCVRKGNYARLEGRVGVGPAWGSKVVVRTSSSGVRPVRPRHCGICVVDHTDGLEVAA